MAFFSFLWNFPKLRWDEAIVLERKAYCQWSSLTTLQICQMKKYLLNTSEGREMRRPKGSLEKLDNSPEPSERFPFLRRYEKKYKKPRFESGAFLLQFVERDYTLLRLSLMVLKTLPMIGPRIMRTAITTMATKTRINAYSTKPWPFSLGENNMAPFLLSSEFFRKLPSVFTYAILRQRDEMSMAFVLQSC
ncbi:MAG: hypothetical protein HUU12_10060 [Anaerolineales bacterium]|nr:hypothetical protein [Anaerolineales bacterium]NUQ59706.1 hypothetical protein [Anaerolineales bacterium]